MNAQNELRALICGGRNWTDREITFHELDVFHQQSPISLVIHGAARGADTLADHWAHNRKIPVKAFPANWAKYGNRAGFMRNSQMLQKGQPDIVIAFPGSTGTADMKRQAQEAGITVIELPRVPL